MQGVAYRVLGTLEARRADEPLPLGPPQQRALLALLLIEANRAVSTDRIFDALWEETRPPATAAKAVQVYVSNLRKQLGAALVTEPGGGGYALAVEQDALDAERFAAFVDRGGESLDAGRAQDARNELEHALALWHGEPFGEFRFRSFVAEKAAELGELRLVALERHADSLLALGDHQVLIGPLDALVAQHPLRERLHAQLVLALYRAGRQAEALDRYDRLRTMLREELGLDPSPELQELHRSILNQSPGVAPAPRRGRVRLPLAPPRLIGRDADLDELSALVADPANRVVTLVGPGGVGKTTLAVAAAAREGPSFPGGATFVDLSAATDDAALLRAVGEALDLAAEEHRVLEAVADGVHAPTLLVLDNFEQLVASAPVVERLLTAAGDLRLLVTSRSPLRLRAERRIFVEPLESDDDAVALFVDRAQAVDPSFELDEDGADVVASICRRLDGLPLALELAAAATRVFSPRQLLDDLAAADALADDTAARDLPERQRTLRTTIDWSYRLLRPEVQRAFRALGVFAAPFTLADATAVCGAPAASPVAALLDQSLLAEHRDPHLQERRFRMLQTIREFALRELSATGEEDAARERHFDNFAVKAWEMRAALVGGGPELEWSRGFRAAEIDMRQALDWAAARVSPERELQLVVPLAHHWLFRMQHHAARQALSDALTRPGERTAFHAHALRQLSDIEVDSGAYESARNLLLDAQQLPVDDRLFEYGVLLRLGVVTAKLGDDERALDILHELRGSHSRRYEASALLASAEIELRRGRFEVARALAVEGATVGARDEEYWIIAGCRIVEAWTAHATRDDERGRDAADAALAILERYFPEANLIPPALEVAAMLVLEDAIDGAAELLDAAEALRETLDLPREQLERAAVEDAWARIAAATGRNGDRAAADAATAIARARALLSSGIKRRSRS